MDPERRKTLVKNLIKMLSDDKILLLLLISALEIISVE